MLSHLYVVNLPLFQHQSLEYLCLLENLYFTKSLKHSQSFHAVQYHLQIVNIETNTRRLRVDQFEFINNCVLWSQGILMRTMRSENGLLLGRFKRFFWTLYVSYYMCLCTPILPCWFLIIPQNLILKSKQLKWHSKIYKTK